MEIRFAGAISLQDFRRAQSVDGRTRRQVLVLIALTAVLLLVPLSTLLFDSMTWLDWLPLLPLLLFWAFFWGFFQFQISSVWKKNQAIYAAVSGIVTENMLEYNTAQSQSTMRWQMFQKSKIAPDMVLLYQTTHAFNVFPRHFFASEADWAAFTRLVEQKIPT